MTKKLILLILFIGVISTTNTILADDDQPQETEPTPVVTPEPATDANRPELIVSAFDTNGNPVVKLDNFDLKNFNIYGPYSFEALPQDVRNQILHNLPTADQDFLSSSVFNRPSPNNSINTNTPATPILNVPFKEADSVFVSLLRRVIRARTSSRSLDPVTGQTVNNGSSGVDLGDSDSQATGYKISGRLGRDRYTDLAGNRERGYKAGFYFKCKFNQIADCFKPRN